MRRAACFLMLLLAGPAPAETLQTAVERALARFPDFQAALAGRRVAQDQVEQARAARLPSVDLLFGAGRQSIDSPGTRGEVALPRREAEITLTQPLFDGGSTAGQLRRAEARAEGQAWEVAGSGEALAGRVAIAYLDVLRLRAQAELSQQSAAVHRQLASQVELLARGGAGRLSDAQQAAARSALAEAALDQVQGQLDQSLAAYRHLTGEPVGELQPPPPLETAMPLTPERALETALAGHPAVRVAQQELAAAMADRDSVRGRLAPRLSLELGMSRNRDVDGVRGETDDRYAMLRLRYNLFRGGADEARLREAHARVDEAAARVARARNDIERDLRQAWHALRADRARMPKLAAHAAMSIRVSEAYRAQFRIGQRSLLDLLNAENEQFAARANVVAALYAIAAGEARVLAGAGRLLAALRVALPEELRRPGEDR